MSDDSIDLIISEFQSNFGKKRKRKNKKRFKVSKTIESKDKHNWINKKQRDFRPNIILKRNDKRAGVDKKAYKLSDIEDVNDLDC